MARRIVIEEPCGHNLFHPHPVAQAGVPDCPGGSRRVLDPGEYVLIEKTDGEWSEDLRYHLLHFNRIAEVGRYLDALAGGEQP